MRLLFIAAKPTQELEKAIRKDGGEIWLKNPPPGSALPDIVIFGFEKASLFPQLEELRTTYPHAWIALVVSKKLLQEPESYRRLLDCHDKDDVWMEQSWESLFWIAVQRAQSQQSLRAEVSRLVAELKHLEVDPLISSSTRLVRQLEQNVELATHIQRAILPKNYPSIPDIKIAAKYIPATGLGGDYYDIFEFGDRKRFGVLLADSKTHGMAAALLSVLLKVRLEEMKDLFPDSRSFLSHLSTELQTIDADKKATISILFGILDRSALTFTYSATGHLQPVLWRGNDLVPIPSSPSVAGTAGIKEHVLTLKPGDLLLLHTDGLSHVLKKQRQSPAKILGRLTKEKALCPDPLDMQAELLGLIDRDRDREDLADDVTILMFGVGARALYLRHSG